MHPGYSVGMRTITKERAVLHPEMNKAIKSGPALKKWRRDLHITRVTYAALSGCSERTLATMEKRPRLSIDKLRHIQEAKRLITALGEIMEPLQISSWLHQRNEWFGKATPMEVIEQGKIDQLWELIYHTRNGGYM